MVAQSLLTLKLTRRIAASPEGVFDAWTDPAIAGRWLFTGPASEAHKTDIDPRPGGAWRIEDRREGVDYVAVGEYLEVERPRRLVFTFGMPQFAPGFSRVTVDLAPDRDGCLLTLTQEGVPDAARAGLEEGWSQMFGQLEAVLAA
jgi:uncharacterized protein YndB with AHSA1/START domain